MKEEINPCFNGGLLPVIVQDFQSLEVLMLAWMNEEAWQLTLKTGEAHYWSRSRQKIWHKGEESGNTQKVKAIRLDCDKDAILLLIHQKGGAACHTGHRSCFYSQLEGNVCSECSPLVFNPADVYKK